MRIKLSDLLPGQDYVVQLRTNQGGEVSEWSRRFPITTVTDNIPPSVPAGFTWEVSGTAFVARWDEVTLNQNGTPIMDFSHYEIELTNDVDTVAYSLNSLQFEFSFEMNVSSFGSPSATVKARLSAVDDSGNRSDWTTQLSATNPAPDPPTNFAADGLVDAIGLIWDEVDEDDIKGYALYLSTVDPGFTPGPANKVWGGSTASVVYPTTLYGSDHYFKLAAVDVFGTNSSYVAADARPNSSFGGDSNPPDQPTSISIVGSLNPIDSGRADFDISWIDPLDTDLSHIVVRYRETGSVEPYQFVTVPAGQQGVAIKFLETNTSYDFQLASVDFSANQSAWTTTVTESVASQAPSKPSQPTVVGSIQSFAISHDLTKAAGGQLESDVTSLVVYLNSADDFGTATLSQTIQISPGSPGVVSENIVHPWPDVISSTDLYIWVVAVSRSGLESTPSDSVTFNVSSITGTYIADATITSAKIQDLVADKIVAGAGIIANLDVKSNLTIGDGVTAGEIRSNEWVTSSGVSGYRLTNNNLIIKSGEIEAAALRLQNSPNLMPAAYSDFEFSATYYDNSKFIIPVSTTLTIVGTNVKYGIQALQVVSSSATSRTLDLAPSGVYNIAVEEGQTYIASMWVYNAHATLNRSVAVRISWGNGATSGGSTVSIPPLTWARVSHVAVAPSGVSSARIGMTYNASNTYRIDGVQFERQETGLTTPSIWKPPSFTSIDGGIVRTGEIRSSQTVLVNGINQPLWSINLTGAAQFGSANVRGTLVIGASGDPDAGQSSVSSGNYSPGTAGWIIKSDGSAELNEVTARGKVIANAGPNTGAVVMIGEDLLVPGWGPDTTNGLYFDEADHGIYLFQGPGGVAQRDGGIVIYPSPQNTIGGPRINFNELGFDLSWWLGSAADNSKEFNIREPYVARFYGRTELRAGAVIKDMNTKMTDQTSNQSVTNTSFTGNGVGHSFVAPLSGMVLIHYYFAMGLDITAAVTRQIWGSFRVGTGGISGGGTQILAPATARAVTLRSVGAGDHRISGGSAYMLEGLTPGATYNVECQYQIDNAGSTTSFTGMYIQRIITEPLFDTI